MCPFVLMFSLAEQRIPGREAFVLRAKDFPAGQKGLCAFSSILSEASVSVCIYSQHWGATHSWLSSEPSPLHAHRPPRSSSCQNTGGRGADVSIAARVPTSGGAGIKRIFSGEKHFLSGSLLTLLPGRKCGSVPPLILTSRKRPPGRPEMGTQEPLLPGGSVSGAGGRREEFNQRQGVNGGHGGQQGCRVAVTSAFTHRRGRTSMKKGSKVLWQQNVRWWGLLMVSAGGPGGCRRFWCRSGLCVCDNEVDQYSGACTFFFQLNAFYF